MAKKFGSPRDYTRLVVSRSRREPLVLKVAGIVIRVHDLANGKQMIEAPPEVIIVRRQNPLPPGLP